MTKEEIIKLRNQGKTFKEIGKIFGVSKQRVYQVCGKARKFNSEIEKIRFKGIYEFLKENPKISFGTLARVWYGGSPTRNQVCQFGKKLKAHSDNIQCTVGSIKRLTKYTNKTFEELFEIRSDTE